MARAVLEVVRPPVVPEALPLASARVAVPAPVGPKGKNTRPEASKPEEHTPSTSQPSLRAPEQGSIASDMDSGTTEEIISDEAPFSRSLKVRLPLGLLKRSHKTSGSGSKSEATPPKVQKEPEAEKGEIGGSTGPSELTSVKPVLSCTRRTVPRSGTFGPRFSN